MGHLIKIRTFLKKGRFLWPDSEFVRRFEGLTLGQIFLNLEQIYKTRQSFRPLTLNNYSAFRFRARGIFLFVTKDNTPLPRKSINLEFFHLFYSISTKIIYLNQKLPSTSHYAKVKSDFLSVQVFLYTLFKSKIGGVMSSKKFLRV